MTTNRITHVPNTTPMVLVDRRWGVDIYHCGDGTYLTAKLATGRPRYRGHFLGDVVRQMRAVHNPAPSVTPTRGRVLAMDAEARAREIVREAITPERLLACPEWRRIAYDRLVGRAWCAELDPWAPRRVQEQAGLLLQARIARRAERKARDCAARGEPGRILGLVPQYRARRAAARRKWLETRLAAETLGVGTFRAAWRDGELAHLIGQVSGLADSLVRAVVRAVGTIGDQAEADLAAMRTNKDFQGKRGRNHKLERTTIERIEHLPDWSGALITMCDYTQYGSRNWGDGNSRYGSRGGCTYRCYLVVRDATRGTAHILRVPPKFGNSGTAYFRSHGPGRARAAGARRIRAAIAWTFAQEAGSYRPQVEA